MLLSFRSASEAVNNLHVIPVVNEMNCTMHRYDMHACMQGLCNKLITYGSIIRSLVLYQGMKSDCALRFCLYLSKVPIA